MKLERNHWRHYFGGVAILLLILQLLTGVFLALFYQPDLQQAYASVQALYRDFAAAAWIRDSHRWVAFLIFAVIIVHVVRRLLRKEFLNYSRRTLWLTGGLLMLPILALQITGIILPWEWRAYWFMEMVPNYLGGIPLVGSAMKTFLIEAFTLSRNFIAHVVILPVIAYVLIDFHILAVLRKRKSGIVKYLAKHAVISIPFFIVVGALAVNIPTPTEDPNIIPMPLEGANVPAPDWFFLFLLQPFMIFEGAMASFLSIYLPLILGIVLIFLPYIFKGWSNKRQNGKPGAGSDVGAPLRPNGKFKLTTSVGAVASFLIVVLVASAPFAVLFVETHESPTLGCNSCHNVSMGTRMGIPPRAFKDRKIIPLVDDNRWMVEHWFYPQVAW